MKSKFSTIVFKCFSPVASSQSSLKQHQLIKR